MRQFKLTCLAGALVVAGCAQEPIVEPLPEPEVRQADSYVVLMPNADGTAGQITYSDHFSNTATVTQAGQGVQLENVSAGVQTVEKEKILEDFRETSSMRPELPAKFLLYFETGGVRLTEESEALIPQILREVESRPVPDVSIIGHTDTVGDADKNEELSLKRAQLLAEKIKEAGLKLNELMVTSHGERNLLVTTPDNTPEPRNRRVEISVR